VNVLVRLAVEVRVRLVVCEGVRECVWVEVIVGVSVRVAVAEAVREPVAVRDGVSVRVAVTVWEGGRVAVIVRVPVGVIVPVRVMVFVGDDGKVRERVRLGVKVAVRSTPLVGGTLVKVNVGVSVGLAGTAGTVPITPQKEGRLPGSVVQAVRKEKMNRQIRMLR
jgi:hypothetical protein